METTQDFVQILAYLQTQLDDVDPSDPNWTIKQSSMMGQRIMLDKIRSILSYE